MESTSAADVAAVAAASVQNPSKHLSIAEQLGPTNERVVSADVRNAAS